MRLIFIIKAGEGYSLTQLTTKTALVFICYLQYCLRNASQTINDLDALGNMGKDLTLAHSIQERHSLY